MSKSKSVDEMFSMISKLFVEEAKKNSWRLNFFRNGFGLVCGRCLSGKRYTKWDIRQIEERVYTGALKEHSKVIMVEINYDKEMKEHNCMIVEKLVE